MALVVLGITGIPGAWAASPAARAVVPESVFNYGTAAEGAKITHTFVIQNKGDARLLITKVETG
ncbi:MAG: DUF1573 domain-containing protein [Desulfobacteraceae bacterium]|nr:DUF1573 domain-containing protein [Desulfobacteraceae bacterium]